MFDRLINVYEQASRDDLKLGARALGKSGDLTLVTKALDYIDEH